MPTKGEVRAVAHEIMSIGAQLKVDGFLEIEDGGIELAIDYMTDLVNRAYDEDEDMTEERADECYRLLRSLNTS